MTRIGTILSFFIFAGCATQGVRQTIDAPAAPTVETQSQATTSSSGTAPTMGSREATAEYHFSLGQAYVAEGNPDRAIEEFKATLMYDPNSALVWARLAAEYVKKGMLSAAMDSCKEAVRRDPKFTDARLMLAGLYSTSREMDLALQEYDRILDQDPTHEEAMVYKAQVLMEENRAEEALAYLKKFVKKNSGSALAWYYYGKAELQLEHFNEAVTAYRKALESNENFSQAALALAFAFESKGQNAKALEVYKGLFDASQDLTAASRISTILLKENKFKEAVPYLDAQIRNDPDDMNVRVKYGLIQMELKDYDLALATFKYILEKNPDSDRVHFYIANLYEERKDLLPAIENFNQIGVESRFFEEAVLHSAFLMKQLGKDAEARNKMTDAIAKAPKIPAFYLFQASLEDEAKNLSAAIGVLEGAAEKFPENERIRYYLGTLYDRAGNTTKGLSQMESIVRTNPEHVDALNYVGYTWTTQGVRLDDAEKLLRKALALSPNNGYIRDSWGWYLLTRGKLPQAVSELERAAKLKPEEPVILEHLGDAYVRSNLREKALQQYRDAARFAEDDVKKKIQGKIENLLHDFAEGKGETNQRVPASSPGASH